MNYLVDAYGLALKNLNIIYNSYSGGDFDSFYSNTILRSASESLDRASILTAFEAAKTEVALDLLRKERNKLLSECDWMANSDVTMTEEWRVFRQALRDITTQTPSLDDNGQLTGVNWPTPPTD